MPSAGSGRHSCHRGTAPHHLRSTPLPHALPTWPVVVVRSRAGPTHKQLTGRPMSGGTPADATTASRSLSSSTRWEVSTAAAAATAVAAPSLPAWKLASAGISDCQATCGAGEGSGAGGGGS